LKSQGVKNEKIKKDLREMDSLQKPFAFF